MHRNVYIYIYIYIDICIYIYIYRERETHTHIYIYVCVYNMEIYFYDIMLCNINDELEVFGKRCLFFTEHYFNEPSTGETSRPLKRGFMNTNKFS